MKLDTPRTDSPATLVAIIVAARKTGDRDLEREMRQRLENRYGVKLVFARRSARESEVPIA